MKSACRKFRRAEKKHSCAFSPESSAFTLVELIAVIAIIAVLAALVFGVARSAIRSSQTVGSLSNMRQLTGARGNPRRGGPGRFRADAGTDRPCQPRIVAAGRWIFPKHQ